ncbi:stage II sporulation protein M [Picrophilus oshimae]|uniref:Uncharacterized membrane protein SpoIIM, required for sporulation n=1 Tax=Picrophilus torridus (strain ATCC 700027 / DSM 9790 / JCM 10055 / NBRC 100828 / KAW 2/3) TaxID=1122961 RepID=A0A8G2FXJ9_PICTO|nr:stage II sporulation protein M [Picrophilus oshimae]SMD31369.1 Uncharacterized membrane protein SpoIIM, required for sporulation [Picrophilus oshimae DSM 9789]
MKVTAGKLFIIFFVLEIAIYLGVSSIPYNNPGLYNAFKLEQSSIVSQPFITMWLSIFPHNLLIATIEFIVPVIGVIFFVYSITETSLVLAAEGTVHYHVSGLFLAISLFLLPDTWLEIPSYAIASAMNIYIIYYLITLRKRNYSTKRLFTRLIEMYLFIVLELAIAGAVETWTITMELANYPLNYILERVWPVSIPAFLLLIFLFRYINREDRKNNIRDMDYSNEY